MDWLIFGGIVVVGIGLGILAQFKGWIDLGNKSPREVLVELQQLVVEFQQLVEQENELAAEDTLQ